jgi:outer membrane lipoprotein SlyB
MRARLNQAANWCVPVSYTEQPKITRSRAMNQLNAVSLLLCVALVGGCAEMGSLGGTKYGETDRAAATQSERNGTIARLENIQVDSQYKMGVGTAVGAVAGGLLGAAVGDTGATVAGAVLGGAAGTYAESKFAKKDAQRITVNMQTGGQVTIVQPLDARLREGMSVRVEGSGENARVVPR